ncbi:MAG: hypothetical protein QG670_1520 [Thermoproteota archaeon]|nr:hypothetical protein [Thermoproteota archaeon]
MVLSSEKRVLWSLRIQVFISGAVVMALELIGSRILAPDFGNSIFVWGSLIGVVLTALSFGYSYGGKLADKEVNHKIFSSILFFAGLAIILIPYLSSIVIDLVLRLGLGERYGPLLITALLMGLPTFLLGMVSPYAIKLATSSLTNIGRISGSLYSLSTFGSITGTFVTVFLLIPSMNISAIVSWLGIILLAVSLTGLGWNSRGLFLLIVLLLFSPFSFLQGLYVHNGNVLYEKETAYSHLDVVDSNGVRTLFLNSMPHSAMVLNNNPINLVFTYTRYLSLGFLFKDEVKQVLFVGGGGFSVPKKFLQDYPEIIVDVVEIDSDVIQVAKIFFNVTDDPRLTIYNEDGRNYLSHTSINYDLIVLDAYSKTYVPFHLMTREFFEIISNRLNEGGAIVSNLITSLVGDTADLFWAEYNTIKQIFPSLYIFHTSSSGAGIVQNVILVASKNPQTLTQQALIQQIQENQFQNQKEMTFFISHLWNGSVRIENAPILTDDFAPVEMLLNPVTRMTYTIESESQIEKPRFDTALGGYSTIAAILVTITIIWFFLGHSPLYIRTKNASSNSPQ